MWTRKELKDRAKGALKGNYWIAFAAVIIVELIAVICTSGVQLILGSSDTMNNALMASQNPETLGADMIYAVIESLPAMAVTSIVLTLVSIFFISPLSVGLVSFFVRAANGEHAISNIWNGFKGNYKNTVWTLFKRNLFVYLWSLLFVIPGIIKSFQYVMVEYILAENPDISSKEALLRSREMMKGNKWKYFVLSLSFIGWLWLGTIAFGIGTLFVLPYMEATFAQFYIEVKSHQA